MRRSLCFAVVAAALTTALAATSAPAVAQQPGRGPAQTVTPDHVKPDIVQRVRGLPGVTRVREVEAPRGYRFFRISFTQPVDHDDPALGTFQQRLTLLHKNAARPMVMYTSGYYVYPYPFRSEPTQIVDGNQIGMEYRFFKPSRPANPDWEQQLTIEQAAADQHHVIRVFKRIYHHNWLTTGGSKGGMTATYHRRFYPDDVSGTVAYVAPNDVIDDDDVYNTFLEQVGTSQQCRDDLTALQLRVLNDRAWYRHQTHQISVENDLTYSIVGSLGKAMEASVVDMYFVFWQYSPDGACDVLPNPVTASNVEVFEFFAATSPLYGYSDQFTRPYVPYYFQAAYQLGAPEPYETRIADELIYPGADVALTFVPDAIEPSAFDAAAMPDIDQWVSTTSSQMLYIYGANDPWSAEPFDCGADGVDRACQRYYVKAGNHGSQISQLPPAKRAHARALVLAWAGLEAADRAVLKIERTGSPRHVASLDTLPDYLLRRAVP